MNQILEYNNFDNNANNKKPKSHKSHSGGGNSDQIAKVFAFILIIFAVALIGTGITKFMKNKKADGEIATTDSEKKYEATITAELDQESEKINILAKSQIEIEKLIYNWNQEPEKTVEGTGDNIIEKEIDVLVGESTLNIKVIDIKGNETKISKEFKSEVGQDLIKPEIKLITEGNKLVITAEDQVEIAFITYKWNDGEPVEVKVKQDAEDKTKIVEKIEIPKVENNITVCAVDTSNNTQTETLRINGVNKPEIIVDLVGIGDTLEITCKHEKGIKDIYYTLNERPYQYTAPEGEILPELKFQQKMDDGYNRIKLKVTSNDGIVAEFDGECEYNPPGAPSPSEEQRNEATSAEENN